MESSKVLHVVATMNPQMGGVCQAIRIIVKGLDSLNLASEIVCLDSQDDSYVSDDILKVHAVGQGKGPWCYNQELAFWLEKNMGRFDAVIIHGLWLYPSYAVRKAFRQLPQAGRKVPKVFVMPHGMLDPYFQLAKGRKLKAIRNWLYWKLIEKKVVNDADGLLFTCEEEKKLASQPFRPYQPKREWVVGLGVEEPPTFSEQMRLAFLERCPEIGSVPFLLFLSRIHEKKGVDLLIDAYLEVYYQKSRVSALATMDDTLEGYSQVPKLVIAGPGIESSYGQRINQMVRENPFLREQVYFPGMLSGDSKWGAFYSCEAFVLPSHQENFGIAVAEALACGKPVLISDQVNIWREIEESGAGIIAKDSAEGTQNLLESWEKTIDETKLKMGFNAKSCFVENFSVDLTAKKLVRAIKS